MVEQKVPARYGDWDVSRSSERERLGEGGRCGPQEMGAEGKGDYNWYFVSV